MSRRSDRFKKILPTDTPRGLNATISTRSGRDPVADDIAKDAIRRSEEGMKMLKTRNGGKSSATAKRFFEEGAVQGDSPGYAAPRLKKKERPPIASTDIRVTLDFTIRFSGDMPLPSGIAVLRNVRALMDRHLKEALKKEEVERILKTSHRSTQIRFKRNRHKV